MKHVLTSLLAFGLTTALFVTPVRAGDVPEGASSTVAFDKTTRALMRGASAAEGKKLAEEKECSECHGSKGIASDEEIPNLAGMRDSYLFKQIKDYVTGHRKMEDMNDAVEGLKDKQIADLSAYYASLTAPKKNEKTTSEDILKIVLKGDPKRMLKPCASCHGRWGQGNQYDHPLIAGQDPAYFILTMEEFKNGKRKNDIYSRMRVIAKALTEAEIKGLADYYALDTKK